jgi:hypothetical protein
MNTFKDYAWDSDIEAAMLSLTRKQINDPEYWYGTVDKVDAGYDPATNKPITIPALVAWVNRCKSSPVEEGNTDDTSSTPRRRIAPNRTVSGNGSREDQ